MNLLKRLFGQPQTNNSDLGVTQTIMNACANCWGKQEYDNQYVEKDQLNSRSRKRSGTRKAFVMQFVETYITGVILKT